MLKRCTSNLAVEWTQNRELTGAGWREANCPKIGFVASVSMADIEMVCIGRKCFFFNAFFG